MGRRSNARDRLLSSGNRLFRDHGFAAVGVAQLCSAASVNKGSFYPFFPSKRALLREVGEAAWDETGMLRRWESQGPTDPIGELRVFLEELFAVHYADQESAGRVRGSLVGNIGLEVGGDDDEAAHQVRALLRREEAVFEVLLRAAVEKGEVSLMDPAHAASTLVACVYGLLMLARTRNDLSVLPAAEPSLLRLIGASGHV